ANTDTAAIVVTISPFRFVLGEPAGSAEGVSTGFDVDPSGCCRSGLSCSASISLKVCCWVGGSGEKAAGSAASAPHSAQNRAAESRVALQLWHEAEIGLCAVIVSIPFRCK